MMLPLMISILRDSGIYGSRRMWEASKEQNPIARFYDASPEYVAEFDNIPGLFTTYEEGVLSVDALNPEDKRDADKVAVYEQQLRSIYWEISDRAGETIALQWGQSSTFHIPAVANQMLLVDAMVFVIAILMIASTYRQHIRLFQDDMKALRALGAKKRQINALFYLEFILLFVPAAAAAAGLSSGLFYLLFTNFLEVTEVNTLMWMIFHVDMVSVGIHLAIFFVLAALSMSHALRLGAGKKRPKPRRRVGTTFQTIYLRRAGGGLHSCLLVSIPVALALLLFFNYTYTAAANVATPPDYDIWMTVDTMNHAPFSQEELHALRAMEGVASVRENRDSQRTYTILDERADARAPADVHAYRDLDEAMQQAGFGENRHGVAINKNHARLKYRIGDTIQVLFDQQVIELEVVQLLNLTASDRLLTIYLPDALYDELLGEVPISSVDIKLTDRAAHDQVIATLESRFSSLYYTVYEELLAHEQGQQSAIGMLLLVCVFGGIMLILTLFILSAKLNLYIAAQVPSIRTLYQIGAAKARLRKAFLRQTIFTAFWGLLPPFAVMAAVIIVWTGSSGLHVVFDAVIIGVNLMVAAVWLAVYVLPVRAALASIQIKEGMA
jgi:ABC-type antimicrobial peptide transport system permease subunit